MCVHLLQLSLLSEGDNVLLLLYGSECEILEDILQKSISLCTSFEEAQYSYEGWVLICLLNMNGSPYFFFLCLLFYKCLTSPISRSQSRFQVGGWNH